MYRPNHGDLRISGKKPHRNAALAIVNETYDWERCTKDRIGSLTGADGFRDLQARFPITRPTETGDQRSRVAASLSRAKGWRPIRLALAPPIWLK